MPDKSALGSQIIAAVAEYKNADGEYVTVPITVDTNYSPARVVIELPDRALRDLGKVDIADPLPAGTNVIGHVIADSGSTTAVTGNVTVIQGTATNLKVDASGVAVPVTDNSGSLTVDAPVGTPAFVTTTPSTTGGWSVFNATSGDGSTALTNSAQAIKGSAGTLGGWYIYNPNTSAVYVPIYNVAAGSVTVGTTNPAMVLCIPASSAANLEMTNGIQFGTALSAAAATTAGGNVAPATALEANFWYK